MEIVGIDVGFGFTKAFNGKDSVIFKSLIGDATEIQFRSSMGDKSPTANLHITLEEQSYFIGNYAELQSKAPEFTLDQEKLVENYIKILAVTAAGLCGEAQKPMKVVTGLPVVYLRRDSKRLKEMIRGTHEITYHNFNGKDLTKKIQIDKVIIIPQPIGSIFNLIFDDQGKIKDKSLTSQKLGVVDIGFKTTDLTIFDNLQYIERGSSTMDTGISKCFSVIAGKLKQESNINLELYRIFKFIDTGKIKIRGKEYNISNLKRKVYNQAATTIAADLNRLWEDDWDIDSIILSGGGSVELADYLVSGIKGNVIPLQRNTDARFNNVQGYFKFGRFKWMGASSESNQQTLSRSAITNQQAAKESTQDKSSKTIGWLKR